MGPNGSGKTTLFNLVSGALVPDSASSIPRRAHQRATASSDLPPRPRPHISVGAAIPRLDCAGKCFGRPRLRSRETDRRSGPRESRGVIELCRSGRPVGSSCQHADGDGSKAPGVGSRARESPRLLLLDEFMAGLTPTETAAAIRLIRELQSGGLTVVLVEHIVWALLDVSHRIVVLSAGKKSPTARRPASPRSACDRGLSGENRTEESKCSIVQVVQAVQRKCNK